MEGKSVVIYGGELYHHGVKGQKWGVRNYQNEDGSYKPGAEGRYHESKDNYKTEKQKLSRLRDAQFARDIKYDIWGRMTKNGRALRKDIKEQKRRVKDAKAVMKENKKNMYKENVKKYSKEMDKANDYQEKADEEYRKAKSMYNDLGRTKIGRVITVMRGNKNSREIAAKVNRYAAQMDKASKYQDRADAQYRKAREHYSTTGRTYAQRVLNNMRYDPISSN